MHSLLFFPVVQVDTWFQTGILLGNIYCTITLTGDRIILPVSLACAPSENSKYTEMLRQLLGSELTLIKTCHTDQSLALFKCFKDAGIDNIECPISF